MGAILDALKGLEGESIQRILDYVMGRLSLNRPARPSLSSTVSSSLPANGANVRQVSIRDLKEEKQPESLNQMAALVAYYLSELTSKDERKDEITSADLEKYFKQAAFRLPRSLRMTLPNAAAAGYFDSAGAGRYRLNPVGYNLVVHGLPRSQEATKSTRVRSKPKSVKKKRARR
jgi:hypothetical protein